MTTYGTIPTSVPEPSNFQFISRATERIKSGLGTPRPWRDMVSTHTIALPTSFLDSLSRIGTNVPYFRANYAIVVLLVLFLSLLWHPISLIVFVVMMAAWLFLYFLRDDPLVIFGRTFEDPVVLMGLSGLTVLSLFLTGATVNIVVGLSVGVAVVLVHGALRIIDYRLCVDEEDGMESDASWCGGDGEGGGGGGVRGASTLPLMETASQSFSSSSKTRNG